jgi:aspartate-semialdehyde dehydrogenase
MVIAGASSLLGGELKSLLEESRLAGWDLRLVDEEQAAGLLTEAAGEPAVIQRVDEDTFHGVRIAFLTGSSKFGKECLGPARQAGATIIDFSHASLSDPDATPWFPKIEQLTGRSVAKGARTFSVFSPGGMAVATLALALRHHKLQRLVMALYWAVSEAGRDGIEELETQTSQLLTFQSVGHRVFGTQAAFNLLSRYGEESRHDLRARLLEIRAEVSAAMGDAAEDAKIAVNLIHAPVFYGMAFSACADLAAPADCESLEESCRAAGFVVQASGEPPPSNVSVAGETSQYLGEPVKDPVREGTWWFWGACDNLRVPAWSGVKLAEWLTT